MIWSVSFLDDWVFISLRIQGLVCKLVDVCHALWLLPLNAGYFYKSFWTFSHVVLGHLETFDPFQKCFSGLSRGQEGPIVFLYCCRSLSVLSLVLLRSPVWMQSSGSVGPNWAQHCDLLPFGGGSPCPTYSGFLLYMSEQYTWPWTRPSKDPRNSFHAAFSFLLLCSTPRLLWRSVLVLPNSQLFF